MKMPLEITLIFSLSIQINNYNIWSLTIGAILLAITWICYFLSLITEKQVNIFKKKKVKHFPKPIRKIDFEINASHPKPSFHEWLAEKELEKKIINVEYQNEEFIKMLDKIWPSKPFYFYSKRKRIDYIFSKLNPEE